MAWTKERREKQAAVMRELRQRGSNGEALPRLDHPKPPEAEPIEAQPAVDFFGRPIRRGIF
jgi:hypothetical protein